MTTDFLDPSEEEDELRPSREAEPLDVEANENGDEDVLNSEDAESIAPDRAEQLLANVVPSPIDADESWQDSIRRGNASLDSIPNRRNPIPPRSSANDLKSPDANPEIFLPIGRPGESDVQKLPGLKHPDTAAIEQYSTTQQTLPQRPSEIPPVVVHHLPPQMAGREKAASKEGRKRLRIEVEITLANAERISRIAVEEAKAEFKKLASQATQRLDEKFYEYRANQRLLRRG